MADLNGDEIGAVESPGLFAHLAGLLAAKLAYLRARFQLAGLEAREAGVHYAVILGLAIVALVAVVFGYLFFVIAAVFLVAALCGGGNAWIWVMFGAALLHLLGAGALLFVAKLRLSVPMFTASLDELKKDQKWLKTTAKKH